MKNAIRSDAIILECDDGPPIIIECETYIVQNIANSKSWVILDNHKYCEVSLARVRWLEGAEIK